MTPLRIAFVASEVAPFAKTGGLADVVAALARALHLAGHEVRVFLPRYATLREVGDGPADSERIEPFELEFPGRRVALALRTVPLPATDGAARGPLHVELIDAPDLYGRDGYYTSDPDESLRWAALCRGALEVCQRTGWAPDVVHCNDWHTGLLPLYLRTRYAWDELFAGTRTLLSLHNIGYQGVFGADCVPALGLSDDRELLHQEQLAEGRVNFLVTGILHAHWLSTVSRTYAREIQSDEQGMGLAPLLRARDDHLVGIVNGIDDDEWDPATDPLIPHRYDRDDLAGKARCKEALLREFDLPHDPAAPLLGIVSRMTAQKGFELLPDILPVLLQREDVRLVVLGSGEERYEAYFQWLRDSFPTKVGVYFGYQNELAHRIEAGADLFLMPSRYEPCGLNQMYSHRYGTVPLVRATGGLADTVERWDPERREGDGFVFWDFSSEALMRTLEHALEVWRDRDAWATLVRTGMGRDDSWRRRVDEYLALYERMLSE